MAQGSRCRTRRVPTAFIAPGVALGLAALHPPAAHGGIPARGTIVEGVGPAAVPTGSTRARLQSAWGRSSAPGRRARLEPVASGWASSGCRHGRREVAQVTPGRSAPTVGEVVLAAAQRAAA
jgi:hypothetical protein